MEAVPLVPRAAPPTYSLSPRTSVHGDQGEDGLLHGAIDEDVDSASAAFPIEAEFAALLRQPLTPPRPSTPPQGQAPDFHLLSTPRGGRDDDLLSLAGESVADFGEDFLADLHLPQADGSSGSSAGASLPKAYSIEDEFAALAALQALHELGPEKEAEVSWRMCLLREKLKCLQKSRQRRGCFSWAPALAKSGDGDPVSMGNRTSPAYADVDIWPTMPDSPKIEDDEGTSRGFAAASKAGGSQRGSSEHDHGHETDCSEQCRPSAPRASDPYFHFGDIDEAEREQEEFLRTVLHAWLALRSCARGSR